MFLSAHCLLLSLKLSFSCIILTTVDLKANNVALSLTTFTGAKITGGIYPFFSSLPRFSREPLPFPFLGMGLRSRNILGVDPRVKNMVLMCQILLFFKCQDYIYIKLLYSEIKDHK